MPSRTLQHSLIALAIASLATVAAHPGISGNVVQDGGFEDGSAAWYKAGYGLQRGPCDNIGLASPGADGTATAFQALNAEYGCYYRQDLDSGVTGSELMVLDFSAKILGGLQNTGIATNNIRAVANHQPLGYGESTVGLGFGNGNVTFAVYCNSVNGPCDANVVGTASAPTDGEWHHYQVVLSGASGTGILLIDGVPVAQAFGDPLTVSPPEAMFIGDTAGSDSVGNRGPAPDVQWDEIYFGPSAGSSGPQGTLTALDASTHAGLGT